MKIRDSLRSYLLQYERIESESKQRRMWHKIASKVNVTKRNPLKWRINKTRQRK
jgi:hypothetical protein